MAKSKYLLIPEYRAWAEMRSRCNNPKNGCYSRYGGRGIRVCERWDSYHLFLSDLGPKPSKTHSLERNDFNGHYSPENCRWATRVEQANNKSNNHFLEHEGKRLTIAQWSRQIGLTEDALERRLNLLNWSIEKALTTPPRGWGPGRPRG